MIDPKTIPDEAVKALERALLGRPLSTRNCTAAIAAALSAWPDAGIEEYVNGDRGIYLPFPTEKPE